MEKRDKIKQLYLNNMPINAIKKQTGLGGSKVYAIINDLADCGEITLRGKIKNNTILMYKSRSRVSFKMKHTEPLGTPVMIMELTNNTCRWPCNGGIYCGADVHKQSYCQEHYKTSIAKE